MRLFSLIAALFAAVTFLSSSASAGGPFKIDPEGSGVALRWSDGIVLWWSDPGEFPPYDNNAAAVAMVKGQFEKWEKANLENAAGEDVVTASLSDVQRAFGFDIDVTNYEQYCYGPSATRTCVIFDEDGSITKDLVGEENSEGIFLGLTDLRSNGSVITRGMIVLNGLPMKDGLVTQEQFEAAALHEVGHLIGLDHTQVNIDIANSDDCSVSNDCGDYGQVVPTMYPDLVTRLQNDLAMDDVITLSWVSPETGDTSRKFHPDFATITGEIFDSNGCFLKGVNVIAMRANEGENMERIDARSMVSGVLTPGYTGDGKYYLYGLEPNAKYKVVAEPIYYGFTGYSDFLPIENPPQDFDRTTIKTPGDDEIVTAPDAGDTFEMAGTTIDVTNPCIEASACPSDCEGSSSSGSTKKLCNFIPGGTFDAAAAFGPLAVLLSIGVIAVRRRNS